MKSHYIWYQSSNKYLYVGMYTRYNQLNLHRRKGIYRQIQCYPHKVYQWHQKICARRAKRANADRDSRCGMLLTQNTMAFNVVSIYFLSKLILFTISQATLWVVCSTVLLCLELKPINFLQAVFVCL